MAGRERLKVLPTVSVRALQDALQKGFEALGHRNLLLLVPMLEGMNWKTSACKHACAYVHLEHVLKPLLSVCSNGLLPDAMLLNAFHALNAEQLLHEDSTNGCQSTRTCDLQKCLGNFGKEVDNSTARNICSPGSLHLSYILSLWCAGQHIARRISEGHTWEFLVSVSVILSLGHFPILILLRIRHCRCRKPWRPLQPWFQCRWPRSLPCLRTGLTFSLRLVPLFFKFLWSNRLQLQGCMGN